VTALFITILNMSITASVVALAVMLVRTPLKKAPKIFSYALWGVVLFRLIVPFSIESNFSLMPAYSNAISQDIVNSRNPAVQTGVVFIDTPLNATIYSAFPLIENGMNPIHTIFEIAGYIWLVGFIVLLAYAVIGYMSLKRRVYYATLIRDNIFESDNIQTPFVLGFIRPKIYFPVSIDPSQHDYILKHEQTHIKRRDYLIKPFAYIVFALHWFNPLMWLSYILMSRDMEMSCDEAVLRKTNEDIRGEYSTSLLNFAVERVSLLNPTAFAFGESNVKERVVNVLSFKKHSRWVIAASFITVAVFLVGFTSNRVAFAIDIPSEQITASIQHNVIYSSNTATALSPTVRAEQLTERFEMYREFGLIFDPISEHLYFDGELVRYFSDMIPLPDAPGASFGARHFIESGTVDVRAVRDLSQPIQNPDGSTDPSGILLGLERVSQAEFDARDINTLMNPSMILMTTAWVCLFHLLNVAGMFGFMLSVMEMDI